MSSASTGGTEGSSPASSPTSAASQAMAAPKYGTLVPNRIFVGGISASTSEAELAQLFSTYGNVKATKIILDRAGVSKGYGFVTFETEEEAKRLQQEPECIILRERKLNIAPAIKKQPFNRSFDGGSPPAVPTSPYYYTNGMGLPYQNGLTFYNAGAPAPGTPLAPPADPAALYQAAGVFGPQAASAHQTFAPMMYPCPAPSLYMPQQYQYSPMPYESYYAGAAGQPQYLYSAGNGSTNSNSGGTATSNGNSGTGATSPPSSATHHYYTTTGPPPAGPGGHHHHATVPTGPSTPQLDHLYYSFATGPHPPPHLHSHQPQQAPPPSQQHNPMGLGDPQLLLYTTDCQQPMNTDTQNSNHEETRSTSSHSQSDHQTGHQQHQIQSTVNETHTTNQTTSTAPLVSLMPLKYPRYPNYPHPHSHFHPHSLSLHPTATITQTPQQLCRNEIDESNASPMHCRTILYHPVCIQNPYNGGASLLPTPTNMYESQKAQNIQNSSQKLPYTSARAPNGYALFPSMHQASFNKSHAAKALSLRSNNPQFNRKPPINNSSCYGTQRSGGFVNSPHKPPHTFINPKTNLDYSNTRRSLNSDFSSRKYQNPNFKVTSTMNDNNGSEVGNVGEKSASPPPAPYSPMTRPLPNYSPTNVQVHFYNSQARYQGQGVIHQGHQQQRRYGSSMGSQVTNSGRKQSDKFGAPNAQGFVLRSSKFKVNGMMQVNSKNVEDGVVGDSQQTRMPLTPPGTPRNLQDNQISDSCHQMQAMTL